MHTLTTLVALELSLLAPKLGLERLAVVCRARAMGGKTCTHTLLALLVRKYKYTGSVSGAGDGRQDSYSHFTCFTSTKVAVVCRARAMGGKTCTRSLLALLVRKYKYT